MEDAIWFAFTTITISGFGDVYPFTTTGRIIAAIMSFIGLALILGFISNIGTSFIISKLSKNHKKQLDETKEMVKNKMNTLEQLQVNDNIDLVEKIKHIQEYLNSQNNSSSMCTKCKINVPLDSIYCYKCGNEID